MYIDGPGAFWRAYEAGGTGQGLMVLSLLTLVMPWPDNYQGTDRSISTGKGTAALTSPVNTSLSR